MSSKDEPMTIAFLNREELVNKMAYAIGETHGFLDRRQVAAARAVWSEWAPPGSSYIVLGSMLDEARIKVGAKKGGAMSQEIEKQKFLDMWGGTLISGTMRDEDLGPAFLDVLEEIDPDRAAEFRADWAEVVVADWEHEDATEAVFELFDALDAAAPYGVYFGATEGDGSDFGFWEVESDE